MADSKANEKLLQLDESHVSVSNKLIDKLISLFLPLFRLIKLIKLAFFYVNLDNRVRRKCTIIVSEVVSQIELIFI